MSSVKKIFKTIARKVGTTMRNHGMLAEGDRVLVGLSGGKDSMILLEALSERGRAVPFRFEIEAAHVEARGIGYSVDLDKISTFCENLEVPLHVRGIEPDLEKDPDKGACFICSWHRRKVLFDLTKELNCNRLALGHHRQDAVETLLMNMIYHGSMSSLPYSLDMFEGRVKLIRPLMDVDERILVDYASVNDMVSVHKSCPHEDRSKREKIRRIIRDIEALHGKGPYNLFKSMGKICGDYLPGNEETT